MKDNYFEAVWNHTKVTREKKDGFVVPLDSLPEEYQKKVKQARAEGGDIGFHTE